MGPAACRIRYDTSQTMSAVILREDFPFLLVACSVADEAQGRIVGGEVEDRANNKAKTASQENRYVLPSALNQAPHQRLADQGLDSGWRDK